MVGALFFSVLIRKAVRIDVALVGLELLYELSTSTSRGEAGCACVTFSRPPVGPAHSCSCSLVIGSNDRGAQSPMFLFTDPEWAHAGLGLRALPLLREGI